MGRRWARAGLGPTICAARLFQPRPLGGACEAVRALSLRPAAARGQHRPRRPGPGAEGGPRASLRQALGAGLRGDTCRVCGAGPAPCLGPTTGSGKERSRERPRDPVMSE